MKNGTRRGHPTSGAMGCSPAWAGDSAAALQAGQPASRHKRFRPTGTADPDRLAVGGTSGSDFASNAAVDDEGTFGDGTDGGTNVSC
jgi:hypothetical protein